jgi:type II secretion system (T2SS) protein G
LKPVEISILNNTNKHVFQKMIASTRVPRQHVKTFRTARTAAVLLLLLSSTVVMGSGQTEGAEPMPAMEMEQVEVAEAKMSAVQDALEAYRIDYGRYPETERWLDTPGPLAEYLSNSDLFDPWKRKFHYEAVMEGGEIVNYRLESLGLDPDYPSDNIPCPIDTDEHLFSGEEY